MRLLLVDDSENDALLIKRNLSHAGFNDPLFHLSDSQRAMGYLNGDDEYSDRKKFPLPDVIFLDLKMPILDGFQLLKWIKSQPHLERVIVIAVTGMQDVKLIQRAYEFGAASFLSKDATVEEFENMVRFLKDHSKTIGCEPRPSEEQQSTISPSDA